MLNHSGICCSKRCWTCRWWLSELWCAHFHSKHHLIYQYWVFLQDGCPYCRPNNSVYFELL